MLNFCNFYLWWLWERAIESVFLSVRERLFRNVQLCQTQCFGLQLIYFTHPHFIITFLNYFSSFYYFCEFWNWDAILASACFVKENMLYPQPWGNVIVPYNPSFFLRTESLVYFGGWTAFSPAPDAQTVKEEIVIFIASAHWFSSGIEEEVTASRAWELSLALTGSGLSIRVSCSVHFCIHSLSLAAAPWRGNSCFCDQQCTLRHSEQISVGYLEFTVNWESLCFHCDVLISNSSSIAISSHSFTY